MTIQPALVRSYAIIGNSYEDFENPVPPLQRVIEIKPHYPKVEDVPALNAKRVSKYADIKRNPKIHDPNEDAKIARPSILKKRPLEADDEGTLPLSEEKRVDTKVAFNDEETLFNDYEKTPLYTTFSEGVSSSRGEVARITLICKAESFVSEYLLAHKEAGMDVDIPVKEKIDTRRRTLQTDSLRARMARVLDGQEMVALCRIITLYNKYQRLDTALSGQLLTLFLKLPETERNPFRFNLTETTLTNLLEQAKER
jgi:hypothetical protein